MSYILMLVHFHFKYIVHFNFELKSALEHKNFNIIITSIFLCVCYIKDLLTYKNKQLLPVVVF